MRSHWMIAALLSSALAAGCNGRNNDNSQNPEQNPGAAPAATDQTVAPAPPAETQQPYSTADNPAVRTQPQNTAPRATTGQREVPRTSAPSRTQPAPAPRLPEYREVTIPAGTALPLEMTSTISSESAQVEAPVSARLRSAIVINRSEEHTSALQSRVDISY